MLNIGNKNIFNLIIFDIFKYNKSQLDKLEYFEYNLYKYLGFNLLSRINKSKRFKKNHFLILLIIKK